MERRSFFAPAECYCRFGWAIILALVLPPFSIAATAGNRVGTVTRSVLSAAELAAPQRAHFMLKLRNYEELCRRVEKGEVLSLKELSDRYLPQEDTWNKVAAWAVANGYKVQPEEMTHMTVFGETTVAKVQKTLGLHYARMVGTDGKEYTSTSEIPSLPAELADCVIGIAGLRSHIKPRPSQTAPITITANGNSYLLPQGLRQMYNANNLGLDGSGQTIVILESDVVNPSDLTAYWTQCGLPTTLAQFTEIDADPNNLPATAV